MTRRECGSDGGTLPFTERATPGKARTRWGAEPAAHLREERVWAEVRGRRLRAREGAALSSLGATCTLQNSVNDDATFLTEDLAGRLPEALVQGLRRRRSSVRSVVPR